jgi:hypothetical protein
MPQAVQQILEWMSNVATSIRIQFDSLRVASSSLDHNLLFVSDAYDTFSDVAQSELKRQNDLLQGIDVDLNVIAKVRIHPEFLSTSARTGERARCLGDYVSNAKMKQVAENSGILHGLSAFFFYELSAHRRRKLICKSGTTKLRRVTGNYFRVRMLFERRRNL